MKQLLASEIKCGRVYRAKKPMPSIGMQFGDRQVKWISSDRGFVQYDGPMVSYGAHYPKVEMAAFLKWALRDVTSELPKDDWATWDRDRATADRALARGIE